ncbi:MAG TPA: nucleoside-diphosphate kinase [Prolixibacteraceae bacterium]|nr:nucleoside-diphosphate kinase [Prolixibacteraceae bacterium]
MKNNLTFTIIKPEAFANNNVGPILEMINLNGFRFVAMKMVKMNRQKAEVFYDIHQEKPFFNELIDYMTSGPVVVAVVEKSNAVEHFRELIGSTDPSKAQLGTIRRMFAKSKANNAIHGSDSDENAKREIELFFSPDEIFL